MIKTIKGFFVMLFVTTALLSLAAIATAADIYVDVDSGCTASCGSESDPYLKIQDAIDNSSPGDTIKVAVGTYNEQLNIVHSLTVRGAGADVTIIDSEGYAPVVKASGASEVTIESLTVTGGIGEVLGSGAVASTPPLTVSHS